MNDRDQEAQLMGFNSHEQYEAALAAMTTGEEYNEEDFEPEEAA